MAWIGLGDRDKLIEDLLDSSTNPNSYWTAEQNCNAFIDLKPPTHSDPCVHPVRNSSRCDSKPSGALNAAGIIVEFNPAAAAGPEGLWPGGTGGALYLTG